MVRRAQRVLPPPGGGRDHVRGNGSFKSEGKEDQQVLDGGRVRDCAGHLSRGADSYSADLHGSSAQGEPGDAAGRTATATAATATARGDADRQGEAASPFDGCRQTGGAESHPQGSKDY